MKRKLKGHWVKRRGRGCRGTTRGLIRKICRIVVNKQCFVRRGNSLENPKSYNDPPGDKIKDGCGTSVQKDLKGE